MTGISVNADHKTYMFISNGAVYDNITGDIIRNDSYCSENDKNHNSRFKVKTIRVDGNINPTISLIPKLHNHVFGIVGLFPFYVCGKSPRAEHEKVKEFFIIRDDDRGHSFIKAYPRWYANETNSCVYGTSPNFIKEANRIGKNFTVHSIDNERGLPDYVRRYGPTRDVDQRTVLGIYLMDTIISNTRKYLFDNYTKSTISLPFTAVSDNEACHCKYSLDICTEGTTVGKLSTPVEKLISLLNEEELDNSFSCEMLGIRSKLMPIANVVGEVACRHDNPNRILQQVPKLITTIDDILKKGSEYFLIITCNNILPTCSFGIDFYDEYGNLLETLPINHNSLQDNTNGTNYVKVRLIPHNIPYNANSLSCAYPHVSNYGGSVNINERKHNLYETYCQNENFEEMAISVRNASIIESSSNIYVTCENIPNSHCINYTDVGVLFLDHNMEIVIPHYDTDKDIHNSSVSFTFTLEDIPETVTYASCFVQEWDIPLGNEHAVNMNLVNIRSLFFTMMCSPGPDNYDIQMYRTANQTTSTCTWSNYFDYNYRVCTPQELTFYLNKQNTNEPSIYKVRCSNGETYVNDVLIAPYSTLPDGFCVDGRIASIIIPQDVLNIVGEQLLDFELTCVLKFTIWTSSETNRPSNLIVNETKLFGNLTENCLAVPPQSELTTKVVYADNIIVSCLVKDNIRNYICDNNTYTANVYLIVKSNFEVIPKKHIIASKNDSTCMLYNGLTNCHPGGVISGNLITISTNHSIVSYYNITQLQNPQIGFICTMRTIDEFNWEANIQFLPLPERWLKELTGELEITTINTFTTQTIESYFTYVPMLTLFGCFLIIITTICCCTCCICLIMHRKNNTYIKQM